MQLKKLRKMNHRPMSENLPNLVTLVASSTSTLSNPSQLSPNLTASTRFFPKKRFLIFS
jgi:hypothetical protein